MRETEDCEWEAGEVESAGGVEVGKDGRRSGGRHSGQVYVEDGSGGRVSGSGMAVEGKSEGGGYKLVLENGRCRAEAEV